MLNVGHYSFSSALSSGQTTFPVELSPVKAANNGHSKYRCRLGRSLDAGHAVFAI
jgi:hypothetical protein